MSRITRAALGAAANAAGLDTPDPGRTGRFRRSITLAIATGAGGVQAASVAAGAMLRVAFTTRDVDARAAGAPEPAALQMGAAGLVLSLPRARRLVRVRLQPVQPGDQVAAFRFDGQAVADNPVTLGSAGPGGAALGVTDARLILRRRRADTDIAIMPGEVASVTLGYAPVNPRLGFVLPDDGAGETFLPAETDATTGQPIFPAIADRGDAFAQALSDRLARRSALPASLALTLILEADEPCSAAVEALDARLVLERRGFSDGADKRVLRFPGGRRDEWRLAIPLPPPGAEILSASFTAVPALDATAGRGAIGSAEPGPAAPFGTGDSADGVALPPSLPVATRLTTQAALAATGADAVLAAPEGRVEMVASLWDERDGLPGTRVAESRPVAVTGPRPSLVSFAFPQAVAIPEGPVWLVLTASRGRGLLLLQADAADAAVALGGPDGFTRLAAAAGRGAAVRLRSAPSAALAPAGTGVEAAVELTFGGVPVRLIRSAAGGGPLAADLLPALTAPGTTGATGGELLVRSSARGLITIDPPMLRYVLP